MVMEVLILGGGRGGNFFDPFSSRGDIDCNGVGEVKFW